MNVYDIHAYTIVIRGRSIALQVERCIIHWSPTCVSSPWAPGQWKEAARRRLWRTREVRLCVCHPLGCQRFRMLGSYMGVSYNGGTPGTPKWLVYNTDYTWETIHWHDGLPENTKRLEACLVAKSDSRWPSLSPEQLRFQFVPNQTLDLQMYTDWKDPRIPSPQYQTLP